MGRGSGFIFLCFVAISNIISLNLSGIAPDLRNWAGGSLFCHVRTPTRATRNKSCTLDEEY